MRAWALDFAPDDTGADPFPKVSAKGRDGLHWQNDDWDPALRFWSLPFDPQLNQWLRGENTALPSIMAAREFASEYAHWKTDEDGLKKRGWLNDSHLAWKNGIDDLDAWEVIDKEIEHLYQLMADDRDKWLPEINNQADGLPGYFVSLLGIDADRRPWTIELIRCGLAIGNLVYMNYKAEFKRVRPSTISPGLVPPFGPPRHPAFPSGHSFLGHFIALLLLEIPEVVAAFGEPDAKKGRIKPTLKQVLSTDVFKGPLLWLGARLAKNRERLGVHYESDSNASRWLAGALADQLLTISKNKDGKVEKGDAPLISCPTLHRVLHMAQAEWRGA